MSRDRPFLTISGIDGSGKTTQIELLEKRLKREGFNTKIVWCRWRPILSLPLLSMFFRLGYARIHPTSSIGFVETRIPRTGGLASLWCFLTQLDNLMKNGLKVMIPLLMGRTVICDRYVLDLVVEGMGELHDKPEGERLGYKLLNLMPRPDRSFLITVKPEVAFERKPDMPTLSHFTERVELYGEMGRQMHVINLDGSQSPEAIHSRIWDAISSSRG